MYKKLFLIIFVFLCGASRLYAAPSYGTTMPEERKFFLGGQTYFVADRNLEENVGEMSSVQHFLLISYGLKDWFSIDVKGGAGNMVQRPETGGKIIYPSYMSGGYGFRVRVYDQDETKVVFGFQHISVHPYSIFVDTTKHKAVIDDWQFSFLASHKFSTVTPYLGMRWSRMDYIHWTNANRNRVKSDLGQSIGGMVGVDIPFSQRVWVNLEGQFGDAKATAMSLNMSF